MTTQPHSSSSSNNRKYIPMSQKELAQWYRDTYHDPAKEPPTLAFHSFGAGEEDLRNFTLIGVQLPDSSWSSPKMQHINLGLAEIPRAIFVGCNLDQANFSGSILWGAQFTGCHLTLTIFSSAELGSITFQNCTGKKTAFASSNIHFAVFTVCDLQQANFSGAHMPQALFTGCDLRACDISSGEFQEATFRACDLSFVSFSWANLQDVDFGGSTLYGMTLFGCDLKRAKFDSLAQLKQAELGPIKLATTRLFERVEPVTLKNYAAYVKQGMLSNHDHIWGLLELPIPTSYDHETHSYAASIFLESLQTGDTPESSPLAAVISEWLAEVSSR